MSKLASPQNVPGPVVLSTPEVQQAQHLLAHQQMLVAMQRARQAIAAEAPRSEAAVG